MLAMIYGWFNQGVDTDELKEANVMLDELEA